MVALLKKKVFTYSTASIPKSRRAILAKSKWSISPCKRASGSSSSSLPQSSQLNSRDFPKIDLLRDHSAIDILNSDDLLLQLDKVVPPKPIKLTPPVIAALFFRKDLLDSITPPVYYRII